MSLFKMWEEAHKNNRLPKEWSTWEKFRSWALTNRYKSEYGYKGGFSPQGCLKAMPDNALDAMVTEEHLNELKEDIADGKTTINDARSTCELELIEEVDKILVGYDLASGPDKTATIISGDPNPPQKGESDASKTANSRSRKRNSV